MYVCVCMYVCMYVCMCLTEMEKDETVKSKLVKTIIIWTKETDITEHQHDIISYDFHFRDVTVKVNR